MADPRGGDLGIRTFRSGAWADEHRGVRDAALQVIMDDILDQADIDALLAAVDTGEIEEEAHAGRLFSRHRRSAEHVEIRPYDFKRPERVSKEQMRALETLHDSFARILGAQLSGFIRTIVEVKVSSVEQMTYSEFISGLPNPTSFCLINAPPLDGKVCLEISPLIVYPIIDRLLGGSNQDLFIPQRPMTVIENSLISVILRRATNALREAWLGIREINFDLSEMESNPQLVQIVPPNEVVVVIGFELKLTTRAGTMNLCIPFNVIEPLMEELSAQSWFNVDRNRSSNLFQDRVARSLSSAVLQVSAVLAETTMTLEDLIRLSEGDVIMAEKPCASPVVLCVEGQRKFVAQIGQYRGNRALKVVRPFADGDRV